MDLRDLWLILTPFDAALLIFLAGGTCIAFGGRRLGAWLLVAAFAVLLLPVVMPDVQSLSEIDWRKWLPSYIDDRVVIYALCVVGFLVAMNVLRHILAFFVGYGAADSAVGHLLASAIASVFVIFRWPFRAIRRIARGSRPWGDDV